MASMMKSSAALSCFGFGMAFCCTGGGGRGSGKCFGIALGGGAEVEDELEGNPFLDALGGNALTFARDGACCLGLALLSGVSEELAFEACCSRSR